MTFGSLINWGGFGKTPAIHPIERYHSGGYHSGGYHSGGYHSGGGGYWEHKSGHSKSYGKGGGGSGAALSALTLLAFLFLLNVMQQSLQDNNTTITTGNGAMTLLLRNGQQPVALDAREETAQKIGSRQEPEATKSKSKKKGDTLDDSIDSQIYVIPVP